MTKIFIEDRHLNELKEIFRSVCPSALVWAYGSRINGTAHSGSDLDLAIVEYGGKYKNHMQLKKSFEESHIPFLIDVYELITLPESFQKEIWQNHAVLYDGRMRSSYENEYGFSG